MKYEKKKLQRKAKETVITGVPEIVLPVERGANLSPESEDRNESPVISELREEIGAAKASADAAKKKTKDVKSMVPDGVPGVHRRTANLLDNGEGSRSASHLFDSTDSNIVQWL
jgi:hypothetical protein